MALFTQVVELDLQGNNFGERISPKAFVGVGERLLALNLEWSNVTRLSGKVFRGLKAVRNMSLAENHLHRLPSAIFDDLRSVERLKLAGNSELKDLPRRLFRNQYASLQVRTSVSASTPRSGGETGKAGGREFRAP